jgi:isopentenyldiphosphate isomerase
MNEELLEVVDHHGHTIRLASRSEVHGNPELIHKVVHVLVMSVRGEILLQKRSMNKDTAPGLWDTSVGGHMEPEEEHAAAAVREMAEELGIKDVKLTFLYSYLHSDTFERELVFTFLCTHNGPFHCNREEIDMVAFWPIERISETLNNGVLSKSFEDEFKHYCEYLESL